MKVLFDTNVTVDILTNRQPFCTDSIQCYRKLIENDDKIFISTVSVADVMYMTRKHYSNIQKQFSVVSDFLSTMKIAKVCKKYLDFAFSGVMTDFEDGIQACCAKRHHAKLIITRNVKDFVNSPVLVVTPTDFLAM